MIAKLYNQYLIFISLNVEIEAFEESRHHKYFPALAFLVSGCICV
jgi:hypothetical protein